MLKLFFILWAQVGIAASPHDFIYPCELISGSKDLYLSGCSPTELLCERFQKFQIIVHLRSDGGGAIWSPEDPARIAVFDRIRFSSVTHSLPDTAETIGELLHPKRLAKRQLDFFYNGHLTGGDAHLSFERLSADGSTNVVAELSSILGQKNSFHGFLSLTGPDQKRFIFHHIQTEGQILYQFPMLTDDGQQTLLVIRLAEAKISLYRSHSHQSIDYNSTQASIYGEFTKSDRNRLTLDAARLALSDLRTERPTVLEFFEVDQQKILELRNFGSKGEWRPIHGAIFPKSRTLTSVKLKEDRSLEPGFRP